MSEISDLDDSDDDWEDDTTVEAPLSVVPVPGRQLEIRRRIEERLEAKRFREEFGDL